jgi:epoxyqueuosine reductase QueG
MITSRKQQGVMKMREVVDSFITNYVRSYSLEKGTSTNWLVPLVAYADAGDPLFVALKKIVSPSHAVPTDFLADARTVIAYFLPFDRAVVESNIPGIESSRSWAVAYVETNTLISDLNEALAQELERHGYRAALILPTHNFDKEKLISNWSHRHVAYIAGLGKVGINNMLITAKGCCGRIGTLVTNAPIEPTLRVEGEYCLYKVNGGCGVCTRRCVNDALSEGWFDRKKCYDMCLKNASRFHELGLADVCGKCLVGLPCSYVNPVAASK